MLAVEDIMVSSEFIQKHILVIRHPNYFYGDFKEEKVSKTSYIVN